MMNDAYVLDIDSCVIEYETPAGRVRSLDSASLRVRPGEVVALVGESGSGKSTLGMASGRLLAANAIVEGGSFHVCGVDVFHCADREITALRRDKLGFVFQNPIAALDPTMRVGRQMRLSVDGTHDQLVDALVEVGLADAERVLSAFPHEISGGMAQRVGIAMALRRQPQLLVADEPTGSVDASLREQLLQLLVESCRRANCALLLLTHDLHLVARYAERVAVMYGGRVVETGQTRSILEGPAHPYTAALLASLPGHEDAGQRLASITGIPPVLIGECPGCAFAPRCPSVTPTCTTERPVLSHLLEDANRLACCHLVPTIHSHEAEQRTRLSDQLRDRSVSLHEDAPTQSRPHAREVGR